MPDQTSKDRSPLLSATQKAAIFVPLAVGVFALDLASKLVVFRAADACIIRGSDGPYADAARVIPVIPGFFDLQCVLNAGAFSGWFRGWYWFLIIVSVAALAAITAYVLYGPVHGRLFAAALACIAGGTAGNLYDRIAYGAVRDFFHAYVTIGGRTWTWQNFNVADAAICAGAGLWITLEFALSRGRRKRC